MTMARKRPQVLRYFRCCECGTEITAPKRANKQTPRGHIKHMWCYKCKEVTAHEQI